MVIYKNTKILLVCGPISIFSNKANLEVQHLKEISLLSSIKKKKNVKEHVTNTITWHASQHFSLCLQTSPSDQPPMV